MTENGKDRVLVFCIVLILSVSVSFWGSADIGNTYDEYVPSHTDFYIDGTDFSPLIDGVSEFFDMAVLGLECLVIEVIQILVSFISFLLFMLLALKKNCDVNKTELWTYAGILSAVTLVSTIVDMFRARFFLNEQIILFNATYFVLGILFVLLRTFLILQKKE